MRSWLLELVVTGVVAVAVSSDSLIIEENGSTKKSDNEGQRNTKCPINTLKGQQLASFLKIGTRVVRGQDWDWGSQDGGPGKEGRITNIDGGNGWVNVEWDTENQNTYRMGNSDKYDLQLACSETQTGKTIATTSNVTEENGSFTTPSDESQRNTKCPINTLKGQQLASFLKIGTLVVRGQDWDWGSQDGGPGKEGRITNIDGGNGWVNVEWDTGNQNTYRMGNSDKYDLQLACSETQTGKTIATSSNVTEENGSFTTPSDKSQRSTKCPINTLKGQQLASFLKIGTRVVRGQDWDWGSQDGGPGKEGRITNTDGGNGWVNVEWDTGNQNAYRMGNSDKYDLQLACSETQTGKTIATNSNVTEENGSFTTLSDESPVDKNVQEGNKIFGKLVETEITSVPKSSRIQAMQNILEVLKKLIKY